MCLKLPIADIMFCPLCQPRDVHMVHVPCCGGDQPASVSLSATVALSLLNDVCASACDTNV